jgi:hypothetical protein
MYLTLHIINIVNFFCFSYTVGLPLIYVGCLVALMFSYLIYQQAIMEATMIGYRR